MISNTYLHNLSQKRVLFILRTCVLDSIITINRQQKYRRCAVGEGKYIGGDFINYTIVETNGEIEWMLLQDGTYVVDVLYLDQFIKERVA